MEHYSNHVYDAEAELATFTDNYRSCIHSLNYENIKQEHVQVPLSPTGTSPISRFLTT